MSNFIEKTLENIIISNLEKMPSRGLDIFYKNTVNQIAFDTKIADIFTWEEVDDVLHCKIIELKKDQVDVSALLQVFNYKVDLFLSIFKNYPYIKDIKINLVLIGSAFDENVEFMSFDLGIKLYKYRYDIDGVFFDECLSSFYDGIISENYQRKITKGVDVSKKESFTNEIFNRARG